MVTLIHPLAPLERALLTLRPAHTPRPVVVAERWDETTGSRRLVRGRLAVRVRETQQ